MVNQSAAAMYSVECIIISHRAVHPVLAWVWRWCWQRSCDASYPTRLTSMATTSRREMAASMLVSLLQLAAARQPSRPDQGTERVRKRSRWPPSSSTSEAGPEHRTKAREQCPLGPPTLITEIFVQLRPSQSSITINQDGVDR